MRDLVSAVCSMHYQGIMHCDLKFENLKFERKNCFDTIKIYDFGSAKFFTQGYKYFDIAGSPYYMAPEMAAGKGYTEKCDIWSLGVILYELLTSIHPFLSEERSETIENIRDEEIDFENPSIWQNVSARGKNLV